MAVYEFEGRVPSISSSAYVDEDAKVLGDVKIGEQCLIGSGNVNLGMMIMLIDWRCQRN